MTKNAVNRLADELDRVIDHMRAEYDMSYAEAVGVLMMRAHILMAEAAERDPDEEKEDEP